MASRASSRRWLLRDLPRAYVLLIGAAFVIATLTYLIDWSKVRHETAVRPQANSASNSANNDNDEKLYTGSLIVPTRRHDVCWELMFDNRTGYVRDGGYVKCGETARQLDGQNTPGGADMTRLREVGKAFRHKAE